MTPAFLHSKSLQSRRKKMQRGAQEYKNWILNQLERGLSQLSVSSEGADLMAKELVNMQLPSLAKNLRSYIIGLDTEQMNTTEIFYRLCEDFMLCKAILQIDTFEALNQLDVLVKAGYSIRLNQLTECDQLNDHALVLHIKEKKIEGLRQKKTWLYIPLKKKFLLHIEYAFGNSRFVHFLFIGRHYELNYCYYPSGLVQRIAISRINNSNSQEKIIPVYFGDDRSINNYFYANISKKLWINSIFCGILIKKIRKEKEQYKALINEQNSFPTKGESSLLQDMEICTLQGEIIVYGEWNFSNFEVACYAFNNVLLFPRSEKTKAKNKFPWTL